MTIKEIETNRNQFRDLLLLADPDEQVLDAYIEQGYLFGLFEEQLVYGVMLLLRLDDTTIEIKNLAVAEEVQGRGYGKQLINYAKEFCRREGYPLLIVGTGNSGIDGLAFYQKQGFRFFDIKRDFFLKHYREPIFENGIQCLDMLMLEHLISPDQ
jgi:ribosomal protein S18 acetylase RimI-like enzyme